MQSPWCCQEYSLPVSGNTSGAWNKCQALRNTRGAVGESTVTSYMEHQGISRLYQEWGNHFHRRKSILAGRDYKCNKRGGCGEMLSVPIKEDSDCVVILLHKIFQVSRKGRNWAKRWVRSNTLYFSGNWECVWGKTLLDLILILYLSINSSFWPLLQTGLSRLDLFSNSVRLCFEFLTKIKDHSNTEISKNI